jgi:hypothetical protein
MHVSSPPWSRCSIVLIALFSLASLPGCGGSTSSSRAPETATSTGPSPCGSAAKPPATYHHIVVIMEENRTWSKVGGVGFADPAMPYLHALAQGCTTFADWSETNSSQNSLTQYVGLTSGADNSNTVNDCTPTASCGSTDDNLFRQVRVSGGTTVSFVDGATNGCSVTGNVAKHVPALYFSGSYTDAAGVSHQDQDFCPTEVRPLTELDANHLPTFAMITPNLCHDGHDCTNDQVDSFAQTWVSKILAGSDYAAGDTVVMVIYDEDRPMPNLIVAPTATPGVNATAGAGHAALLKTWEQMLGLPEMAQDSVRQAASLRGPAHL